MGRLIIIIVTFLIIICVSFLIKIGNKKELFVDTDSSNCINKKDQESANIKCDPGSYLSSIHFIGNNKVDFMCCSPPKQNASK